MVPYRYRSSIPLWFERTLIVALASLLQLKRSLIKLCQVENAIPSQGDCTGLLLKLTGKRLCKTV